MFIVVLKEMFNKQWGNFMKVLFMMIHEKSEFIKGICSQKKRVTINWQVYRKIIHSWKKQVANNRQVGKKKLQFTGKFIKGFFHEIKSYN